NYILKSSQRLRVRGIIARGETLAELGRYYDAVQQYQRALELDRTNALADFRMGEAFFYQKNYAASAQSFRDALDGTTASGTKWTEVWSHIYLGRIYDIQGDRTRAVNEYSKAKQTADDTGGAQAEAEKSLKKAYTETASCGFSEAGKAGKPWSLDLLVLDQDLKFFAQALGMDEVL